jgi:hypothetical protein
MNKNVIGAGARDEAIAMRAVPVFDYALGHFGFTGVGGL